MGDGNAEWHSAVLYVLYLSLGWFGVFSWSMGFYPQVILNYRRQSVTGLTFDYPILNFTKHSCYLIYNASLYFSPIVQRQYCEKYGQSELVPVGPSDVTFSVHAVLLTVIILFQLLIYEKGSQKVSTIAIAVTATAWGSALFLLAVAWPAGDWFGLVYGINIIQILMTVVKYSPQVYFNYQRKSTIGWSIGNNILDLLGDVANITQMAVQSIDQSMSLYFTQSPGSVKNFTGNVGKLGLSLVSIFFDMCFLTQHFLLYPKREEILDDYMEIEKAEPETAAYSH